MSSANDVGGLAVQALKFAGIAAIAIAGGFIGSAGNAAKQDYENARLQHNIREGILRSR